MTSEHDMYRKVPAAMQVNANSVMSDWFYITQPRITPIGVNKANNVMNFMTKASFPGNVLPMDIPKDIPAAHLCNTMAAANMNVLLKSSDNPRARPSNNE